MARLKTIIGKYFKKKKKIVEPCLKRMCTIIISFLLGTKNVISITKMLWCDSYSTSISTYRVLGGV